MAAETDTDPEKDDDDLFRLQIKDWCRQSMCTPSFVWGKMFTLCRTQIDTVFMKEIQQLMLGVQMSQTNETNLLPLKKQCLLMTEIF